MTAPSIDWDSPWKDILESYFPDFVAFFFPTIHADIDWIQGYTFCDHELQQIVRDAEVGRRLSDKLIKVKRLNGEDTFVMIHLEIQNQYTTNFAERMFVYHYRLRDRYNLPVVSLAVLGDDRTKWKPRQYRSGFWGCEVSFKYPLVKLLDYRQHWQQLEVMDNPFATVVMAHLKAMETRKNVSNKRLWKLWLAKRLYERGYRQADVINLLRFIDWVIQLPEALEINFWQEIQQYQEEKRMPYITSLERLAEQRGEQQGEQRGEQRGLLAGIEIGLELKFGEAGLALLPEIQAIDNLDLLRQVQQALRIVKTLEELQQVYQAS